MKTTIICLFIAIAYSIVFRLVWEFMGLYAPYFHSHHWAIVIELLQAAGLLLAAFLFGFAWHDHSKKKHQEKWEAHLLDLQNKRERQNR